MSIRHRKLPIAALERIDDQCADFEKKLIEEWRTDGTMEIIEDVDVDAFRERCKQHFADGFQFSDVYNRITAEPSSEGDQ